MSDAATRVVDASELLKTTLTTEDLPVLTDKLNSVAYKWYQLGIQLGFQPGFLKGIPNFGSGDTSIALADLLAAWLQRTSPPSTLQSLVNAVGGSVIASQALAKQLIKEFEKIPNKEAVKSRQVGFDNSADSYHEEVHLINYQSVHQTDVRRDNHLTTKETDEHQVETPNRLEGGSLENQKTSDEDHHLTTKEHQVETLNGHVARMEGASPKSQKTSNERNEENHVTTDEHRVETPNKLVPRMESASEIQTVSKDRSVDTHLTAMETEKHQVKTPNTDVLRMEGTSPETQRVSNDRSEADGQDLLQSCTSEQWDLAEALIVSGSTLEAQNKDGRTPLHICCIKGKMEMVKLLIEHGANVTSRDKLDNCCLHHKETLKKPEIASLVIPAFVQKGRSVDQPNKNDVTPLLVACQFGEICSPAAHILITHDARVDGLPTISEKPLICASGRGNIKLVKLLLTYGADVNQRDGRDESTALIQACLCNHPGIVRVLLEKNPNLNLADKDGTTALAAAVSKNAYEMVQMLIEKGGADVNCIRQCGGVVGSYEETPLASACARGYQDVAELLISNGANVNFLCSIYKVYQRQLHTIDFQDFQDAVPPIGFAIICRQQHMIKFLLEVEDYDKSIYGLSTPVDIAVRVANYAAAKILLDARGGPELALQEAQQNHLTQLAGHIELIQNLPESELMLSAVEEPALRRDQMGDQAVKVEEVLQTFSQICMVAITSNTNCEQLLEISKALEAPYHITSFIQEYSRGIHRQDILKAKFLSSDSGMSPANFFITHQFIDTGSFHVHAMEFFPDGTKKFYEELVWTFHQISGGEDLPFNANKVLERLFRGQFSLNVRTGTRGELTNQLPSQHYSWSQPQLFPTALSHEDQCFSTALPESVLPRQALQGPSPPRPALPGPLPPRPALPGPLPPRPALPGPLPPRPALPGPSPPRPALPGPSPPGPALPGPSPPRPALPGPSPPGPALPGPSPPRPALPGPSPPRPALPGPSPPRPALPGPSPPGPALPGPSPPRPALPGPSPPGPALPGPSPPRPALPGPSPPRPALPGPSPPRPALPGPSPPGPALPGPSPPRPALPGPSPPGPALPGPELSRPKLLKPALNDAFSLTDSQPTKAIILDEKQNETGITSAELQQRVTSNVEGILMKQQSLPAELPNRMLVNATVPKLKAKSYSSDPDYHFSEHGQPTSANEAELTETGSLPSHLQDTEETNKNAESNESISAGEMTANQSTVAEASGSIRPETPENEIRNKIDGLSGSISPGEITANQSRASGSMRPETPENERRNEFGELVTQRKEMCKTTTQPSKGCKLSRARKPPHAMVKSTMKGHSTTPGAEGGGGQHLISDVTFLGKRIGEGAFGFVEKVRVDGKICAGKHFKDDCNFKEQKFQKEFKIMQKLKHKHIVIYYGFHKLPKHNPQRHIKSPVLIMEYLVTSLHDFLLSESHKDLPLERKVVLLFGIAQGLDYLHSEGVIHRDLTANNVLLDSKAVPKISDFGNSCVTGTDLGSELHSKSLTRCPGTLNYMAPEAQYKGYGKEIDVFSFGHLSLFVGIQESPTHLKPPRVRDAKSGTLQALDEIQQREKYFTLLHKIIEETHPLVELMKSCLSYCAAERPKAHELVSQLQAMQPDLPLPPLNIKKEQAPAPQGLHKRRK